MSTLDVARGLSRLRPDWNIEGPYQFGEIGSIASNGTVGVYLDGSSSLTTGITCLSSYIPVVNDPVVLARLQGASMTARVVVGRLATEQRRQILTTTATSVSFTPPAGFANLRLRAFLVSVSTSGNIALNLNSDSAAHYNWSVVDGNGTAAAASSATGTTYARIGYMASTAVSPTVIDCLISQADPSYYATSNVVGNSRASRFDAYTATGMYPELYAFQYAGSTAISSVSVSCVAGNMAAGSTFSLVGVP
jgi:hypothetical protein